LTNILHHFGVVRSSAARTWRESRSEMLSLTQANQVAVVPAKGWFCPAVGLGQKVERGDVLAHLVPDANPMGKPIEVNAQVAGTVCCLAARTRQEAGAEVSYIAETLS
jgi:predicted deacylase